MRKLFLTVMAMVFFAGAALAQRTITGKVTDDKGNPLVNASVVVKGTTTGTVTKADGSYTLTVPANAKTLVFSSVNMATQEVSIGSQTVINSSLTSDEKALAEVVVVGYGTQQKKAFTGAASKIEGKEISNLVSPSVDKQLAGRATGVQVTTPSGLVNQPARIRIRGTQSISNSNDPLIVVDGIPIISGNLAGSTNSNAIGDINPQDIESIDVLKDGASTALYGSRAAGGVILITTKKGSKNGKAKLSYDMTYGFSSALKKFDLLNAQQFVTIANEKFTNAGATAKAFLDSASTNTDWQKQVMINNAPVQIHTLSLQGGNQKTNYYLSLNYSGQRGVIISNRNKSYRVRLNLEHEVNKFVKIGNYITLSRQEDNDQNNGSNSLGGAIAATLRLLPNVSPYNPNNPTGYNVLYPTANSMGLGANLQSIDDNWFNVAFTLRNNTQYSDKYRIINNSFVEISPIKGLKLRSQASVDFFNDASFLSYDPRHGDGGGSTNGLVDNLNQNILRYVWQNYFNYNLSVKKHNFFLTGGHEVQGTNTRFSEATGQNISDIYFVKNNIITNTATIQSVAGNYTKVGFESLFGRFNYDYNNKYFVQATIRRDGQSSLAPDKRYGVFPGFSLGWRVSQENFWEPISNVVNEFKIKGSYATVGNALGGFPYLSTYSSFPYGNIGGIAQNVVGNTDLQWETSKKFDLGVEFSLFKSRINVTADYFKNDVDNLVLNVPTPLSAGVPGNSIAQNIGTLENKGLEFSVDASIIRGKKFNWNINANYSNVKNKITSLYSIGGTPVPYIVNGSYNIIRVGDPINILYGYTYAGVNASNGNPVYINAAGQYIQHSIPSGNYNIITDKNATTLGASSPLTFNDKSNLGNPTPTWFGAVTNSFSYSGFDLDFMLRYSGGNKIMNVTRQEALFSQSFHNNGVDILNRWTKVGQETDVPRLYYGQSNNINQVNNALTRFIEKGDYLRLQNVTISYNLDQKLLEKLTKSYVTSLRFFVQGQNLYVWSKYKGADPDNISGLGIDAAVSPQIRTVSFGLNLGF